MQENAVRFSRAAPYTRRKIACRSSLGDVMPHVDTPQGFCKFGIARAEVTPPVGIYHRMWGAATHERATGVHRPLLADVLWLGPLAGGHEQEGQFLVALDHCILDGAEVERMTAAVCRATGAAPAQVQVTTSH